MINYVENLYGKDEIEEVDDIFLDKRITLTKFSLEEKAYMEKFTHLLEISLNHVGLVSLENLPVFENLIKIEVGNNSITDGLSILNQYTKLRKLVLAYNPIDNLAEIECLNFPNLKVLDIIDTPVFIKNKESLLVNLFQKFPKLKILNGNNEDGQSEYSSDYEESVVEKEEEEHDEDDENEEHDEKEEQDEDEEDKDSEEN